MQSRHVCPKLWIRSPDGRIWLRKEPPPLDPSSPNTARRSEPAIEVLALELAKRAGLPIAEAVPAMWHARERGVVSLCFHDMDEQHHPGSELLRLPSESGSSPDTRKRRREAYASATLERVREKLCEVEDGYGVGLVAPFARILAFDAWVGNGDRHSGNWALVTGPRGARLAPMYGPTACLGVELTDERPELTAMTDARIAKYAGRCSSGFGGGVADGRPGILMTELIAELESWPEWGTALDELVPRFKELTAQVELLLEAIPDSWLSAQRKRFVAQLLAHRVRLFS